MGIGSAISKIRIPVGLSKLGLKAKKNAPTLMVTGGIILVGVGTVLACKQTIKANDILKNINHQLDEIEDKLLDSEVTGYNEKDARKERAVVYRGFAWDMARTYGPAVLAITAGLGLIVGSHKILCGRNAVLTAGYSALLANYQNYRNQVRAEIGEEEETKIFSGAAREDVEVFDENGEVVETKKDALVKHDNGSGHSIYARLFSPDNVVGVLQNKCTKSPASNLAWLRQQQQWANDTLRARGYLFLNEVYEQLGFPRTSDGQIVGWLWDPKREKYSNGNYSFGDGVDSQGLYGDNYVDFGIYDKMYLSKEKAEFLNGGEPYVWLDFNVDGVIYDLI